MKCDRRSIYQKSLSYSMRRAGGKEVSTSGEEVDAVRTYINANIRHNILDRRKIILSKFSFYSVNSRIRKGKYWGMPNFRDGLRCLISATGRVKMPNLRDGTEKVPNFLDGTG